MEDALALLPELGERHGSVSCMPLAKARNTSPKRPAPERWQKVIRAAFALMENDPWAHHNIPDRPTEVFQAKERKKKERKKKAIIGCC